MGRTIGVCGEDSMRSLAKPLQRGTKIVRYLENETCLEQAEGIELVQLIGDETTNVIYFHICYNPIFPSQGFQGD